MITYSCPNDIFKFVTSNFSKSMRLFESNLQKLKKTFVNTKMFTKVDALADIHAPFFGPVFSYNLQFLNYFIENKALQAFYFISI